ncbi:peptidase S8 [Thermus scotoductus]|uniref:Peptidase S8 n=5 Tax=Thermus scotoductus TaxID=37636 RepID=A0A430UFR2_THESC|nr:S8 family serine peptidase [Thermus scotoductus]RTG98055.1 peptidase S8 [Thermus scotoductus]RTH06628.1 peptidase S8 [Thermus scotoductus]RTH19765.1 peptidase S8 [Thermus scotoductus]RTH22420.1 peptidase S8 [Thermus scotoductus]RTH34732.1 peptidase S8 [Thermus scotoductus]
MRPWKTLIALTLLLSACSQTPQSQNPPSGTRLTTIGGEVAVAGEILVKYKAGPETQGLRPLGASQPLEALSDPSWGALVRIRVPEGQEEAYIQAYGAQVGVEYAEPNYWVANPAREVLATLSLPQRPLGLKPQAYTDSVTDPYFLQVPPGDPLSATGADGTSYINVPYLWGIYRIRAPEVWNQGYRGQGVVAAVVDEGIDLSHPDLQANLWTNPNPNSSTCPGLHGYDFVDDDPDPSDSGGHGTHVAGTIAAAANGQGVVGVAPEARLMALRALGYFGGTNYMLVRALKYAADCGAKVVNNSWGSGGRSKAFLDVLQYGTAKGVIYVFSAGNSYRSGNRPSYPVAYSTLLPGVIGVGASSNDNRRAGFSNAGPYVTLVAPGAAVLSTIPVAQNPSDPYAFLQGTSMAAPHVTGVVALLLSAKPDAKPEAIRLALEQGANAKLTAQAAKPDYAAGGQYGYGLVDAKASLDTLLGQ